jgi:uncharacterized integral membrane protein
MTPEPQPTSSSRRSTIRLRPAHIATLLILAVTAALIGQNRDRVDIELFTIDISAPLWLVLAIMVLVVLMRQPTAVDGRDTVCPPLRACLRWVGVLT